MSVEGAADALADLLRRTRPVHVVAVTHEGKERPLAIAQGRAARWSQLARLIVSMEADLDRVELRDRQNAIIETWRPMAAEREAELADVPITSAGTPPEMVLALHVQRAVQTAVDHAVDRHQKAQAQVMDTLLRVLHASEQRALTLERMYMGQLKVTHQAVQGTIQAQLDAADAAAAQAADDPMKMLTDGMAAFGQLQALKAAPPTQ
jgi:hypothetical protein